MSRVVLVVWSWVNRWRGEGLLCLTLALHLLSQPLEAHFCLPFLARAAESLSLALPLPSNRASLERDYGHLVFATKKQNRNYRHAFDRPANGKTLAVSLDFPIVTSLNNAFQDKPLTAAVFNLYKRLFFEKLKKDPFLWGQIRQVNNGIKLVYVDYKNIGLIFDAATPEIRQTIKDRIRAIQEETAAEFHAATANIPELVALSTADKSIVKNRRNWVIYGFGDNPMQATATSRLGRYHPVDVGVPPIREFSDAEVQAELKQKFHDAEGIRESAVAYLQKMEESLGRNTEMIVPLSSHSTRKVLSERVWDVLRKVKATDKAEYLAAVKKGLYTEFRVEVSDSFVWRLQKYYHLIDNFLPRVHERREMSIDVAEAPHGAIYVDIRGQTPRNLFRMAGELAQFAEQGDLELPDAVDRLAHAVRLGQDSASRKFEKVRKAVKKWVSGSGIKARIHVSGDEIAILLDAPLSQEQYRSYVATLAYHGLPVRPVLVAGGTRDFNGRHVSKGEEIEKAIRQKLKESPHPVAEWENLTIGVQITPTSPNSGIVHLWLGEKPPARVMDRARDLIQKWLANGNLRDLEPSGYRVIAVQRAERFILSD